MRNIKRVLSVFLSVLLVAATVSISPIDKIQSCIFSDSFSGGSSSAAKPQTAEKLTPSEKFLSMVSADSADISPVIIVPGISHSQVYLADENEHNGIAKGANGNDIENGILPVDFLGAVKEYIPRIVLALGGVLLTQRSSKFFTSTLDTVFKALFNSLECDENGNMINKDYKLEKFDRRRAEFLRWQDENPDAPAKEFVSKMSDYEGGLPTSYAEMYPDDVSTLHRLVTTSYADAGLVGFEERIGQNKMFFFTFSLFGSATEAAGELDEFIQGVKKVTGSSKVTLLNVSLGGTVFTAWADIYGAKNNYKDLDKVVNAVAVLNGTYVIGDFFRGLAFNKTKRTEKYELNPYFNLSDEYLYSKFTGTITHEMSSSKAESSLLGYIFNAVLRLLPREALLDLLSAGFAGFSETILLKTPQIWAMVPSEIYSEISNALLSDLPGIKAKTDEFYHAQCNLGENMKAMALAGVAVNTICGYDAKFGDIDYQYFSVVSSAVKLNSDGVIHLYSTSHGATSVAPGQKLSYSASPLDTDNHTYISPDGSVDASTCTLPDNTWFFKNMLHEDANSNSSATNLIIALIVADKPFDVLDYPEYYSQFNTSANNKSYRRWSIADAKGVLENTEIELDGGTRSELEAIITRAQLELQSTKTDVNEVAEIIAEFKRLLHPYKPDDSKYQSDSELLTKTEKIFAAVNSAVLEFIGGQGYSDFTRQVLRGENYVRLFSFIKAVYDNLNAQVSAIK